MDKQFRNASLRLLIVMLFFSSVCHAQETQIRGFAEILAGYNSTDERISFGLGEQDLFITSELTDRFSFLGETVFKYSPSSPTLFDVSIERIVVKYNVAGNHNILVGKHHTPINYWNDTYHHGRVFFPTIYRPDMFADHFIPLHTTGISIQGHDLGGLKFGYDLMIGNGIGSNEVADNDNAKSVTAAVHLKPAEHLRVGASVYSDRILHGVKNAHGDGTVTKDITQLLYSGSVAYFGKRFEVLAEATLAMDDADSVGTKQSLASYVYAGVRLHQFIPYIRFDYSEVPKGELYLNYNTKRTFTGGIRYEINYLTVIKLEYGHTDDSFKNFDLVTAQLAIGF